MTRKDIQMIEEAYASGLPRAYFSDTRGSIADRSPKTASKEEMAAMLAKNPAANQPMETEYSIEAPEGYEVSYDGDTLTVKRTVDGVESTSMTRMGKKSIDEVQRHVDNQVAYDEFVSKKGGGAGPEQVAAARRALFDAQRKIYGK